MRIVITGGSAGIGGGCVLARALLAEGLFPPVISATAKTDDNGGWLNR